MTALSSSVSNGPAFQRVASAFLVLVFSSLSFAASDISQAAENPKRLLKQAEKFVDKGNYGEAERIYRRLRELQPNNNEFKIKLAYSLLKQQRLTEAYELSLDVAKAEPKNSYAYAVLGTVLVSAGRLEDAREVLYASLNINRREALAWAGFGMIEFFENRIEDSLKKLRIAVYHDATEPDYVFALAQVSARAEQYGEAADAYNTFLRVAKDLDHDRRDRIRGLVEFLRYLNERQKLYTAYGPDITTVSFDLARNRPVIQIKINGNERPLNFVLDTGSGISVISDETAKRLGVRPIARGGYARGIGGDGKFEIVYGFLRELDIGDMEIRNVPVYIRKFHNTTVDGYIGLAVISKFLTTVDYGERSFTLARRNDSVPVKAENAITVPLRLTSSGFLSGEVQVPGIEVPLNFIVDTGASVSVVSDEVAQLDAFDGFERGERMRVIGAAGITEDVPSFLIPKLSFGANTMESVTAIALDLDTINEASGFQQAGILGGNFLRNYRMTFDVRNSQITFTPIEKTEPVPQIP
ncbi:MAG: aspartyl protease family protein [Pyrinomonadaceae bacterium]|nr:aspartyl protease family protein [Pyrinomonadaceae bacterium]